MTMAPIKRKGNIPDGSGPSHPKKRVKLASTEQTTIRDGQNRTKLKGSSSREVKQPSRQKASPDPPSKRTALSYLRDDEPSFPRGGGSILTPLERKQIQIQATQDVLFEQRETNGADGIDGADDSTAHGRVPKSSFTKSRKVKSK